MRRSSCTRRLDCAPDRSLGGVPFASGLRSRYASSGDGLLAPRVFRLYPAVGGLVSRGRVSRGRPLGTGLFLLHPAGGGVFCRSWVLELQRLLELV